MTASILPFQVRWIIASKTRNILLFLIFTTFTSWASATTWHTISTGYWNQSSIWLNGNIPPLHSSDSIYIHHHVALTDDITLTNGGYLKVDSSAGICGHITLTIGLNAIMHKYGYCQIDTLLIPGGDVDFYPPGYSIFSMWGQITNGGSFSLNGSGLTVGAWFQCQKGPVSAEENENYSLNVYPNPFKDELFIENPTSSLLKIKIYDALGNLLLFSDEKTISTSHFPSGIYFIEIETDEAILRKKIIKS